MIKQRSGNACPFPLRRKNCWKRWGEGGGRRVIGLTKEKIEGEKFAAKESFCNNVLYRSILDDGVEYCVRINWKFLLSLKKVCILLGVEVR